MAGLLGFTLADLTGAVDSRKRQYGNMVRGLLSDPGATLAQLSAQDAEAAKRNLYTQMSGSSVMPEVAQQGQQALMEAVMNLGGLLGIVKPSVANTLNVKTSLPADDLFRAAVEGTPGASITPEGLLMRVQRNQLPEQGMAESVRGGVFYLPEGAAQAKHYSTGKNGYGGGEKITGETLVKNPLFAKGGTGGKAPEAAYDALLGKGSYAAMRKEALDVNWGRKSGGGPTIDEFLDKYAPELSGMGDYIKQNSSKGNQLAYALQEAAVGSAVRKAGHDAVLGHSKGKSGPFLSELFDVRESHYPDKFGGSRVWDELLP